MHGERDSGLLNAVEDVDRSDPALRAWVAEQGWDIGPWMQELAEALPIGER